MTHVTQEARAARANARQGRAAVRDQLINNLFNLYTALCLALLLFGAAVARMDAKGVPVLLGAAVLAAVIRLLWTIREELRESNQRQAEQAKILRSVLLRGSETP